VQSYIPRRPLLSDHVVVMVIIYLLALTKEWSPAVTLLEYYSDLSSAAASAAASRGFRYSFQRSLTLSLLKCLFLIP